MGQPHAPADPCPPGKTRYPFYRRLCGPQGQFGQVRKISPPTGFDPRTVQPVASRYTDWATWTTRTTLEHYIYFIRIFSVSISYLRNPNFEILSTGGATHSKLLTESGNHQVTYKIYYCPLNPPFILLKFYNFKLSQLRTLYNWLTSNNFIE